MRTEQEIKEAIERLEENKEKCVRYSAFGDDNHARLDAMIETIDQGFDFDEIAETFGEGTSEQEAADGIVDWLDGNGDIEDYLYPEK